MSENESFWKKYKTQLVAAAIGLGTSIGGTIIARKISSRDDDYEEEDDDD